MIGDELEQLMREVLMTLGHAKEATLEEPERHTPIVQGDLYTYLNSAYFQGI